MNVTDGWQSWYSMPPRIVDQKSLCRSELRPWRSLTSALISPGWGDRLPRTDSVGPCHRLFGLRSVATSLARGR